MLRATLSPLMAVLSMIPPLAILPILFIVFGLDELSKVMLIVIGITPVLARDRSSGPARFRPNCWSRRRPWAPTAGRRCCA